MTPKEFVRADDLVHDAFTLARRIYDSGYRPDTLVVLWRGGTPVGIVIHEFLLYKGVRTYHTAVKAESYTGKVGREEVALRPDYYLRRTDRWIVFPHELMGLTAEEIRRKDEFLCDLLDVGRAD
jgi:hypoxanthine phosphoribosyltransferase